MKRYTLLLLLAAAATIQDPGYAQNANIRFGWSVDVNGDDAIISMPFRAISSSSTDDTSLSRIFIYTRDDAGLWSEAIDDPGTLYYGYDVAVSDYFNVSWAVIGVPGDGYEGVDSGGLNMFIKWEGNWQFYQQRWQASVSGAGSRFGTTVDINGSVVAARGQNYEFDGYRQSFVAVFEYNNPGNIGLAWRETAILVPPELSNDDSFGESIVIVDENTLVVSAPTASAGSTPYAGVVYVYSRVDGVWEVTDRLERPWPESHDRFGHTVSVSGDLIAVGAPASNANGINRGSVHVFERGSTGYQHAQEIGPAFAEEDAAFGHAVILRPPYMAVGVPGAREGNLRGDMEIYQLTSSGQWSFRAGGDLAALAADLGIDPLTDTQVVGADLFALMTADQRGYSLSADDSTLVLGVPHADTQDGDEKGAVLFLDLAAIDANRAPVAQASPLVQMRDVGPPEALPLWPMFYDADGDDLSYSVESADTTVALAWILDGSLYVAPTGSGTTNVDVAASDTAGRTAIISIEVRVAENLPPAFVSGTLPSADGIMLAVADGPIMLDLDGSFADPEGDGIQFGSSVDDAEVATATTVGSTLTITALATGSTTVRVQAEDTWLAASEVEIEVTVPSGVGTESDGIPDRFEVRAAYPNPAAGVMRIPVMIPATTFVTARVFAADGRVVATLQNGDMVPGRHTLTWNTAMLPSGIYLIRTTSGLGVATAKAVVVH